METRLGTLRVGDEGIVSGFSKGARDYRTRVMAMGLTKGTRLRVVRSAPLGDPIEISVRGFALSLRRKEAEAVLVRRSE
jgi:ferrous iron transport protein A